MRKQQKHLNTHPMNSPRSRYVFSVYWFLNCHWLLSVSLQLIDSFTWELGALKKEMAVSEPEEGDRSTEPALRWVWSVSVGWFSCVSCLSSEVWLYMTQFSVATSRGYSLTGLCVCSVVWNVTLMKNSHLIIFLSSTYCVYSISTSYTFEKSCRTKNFHQGEVGVAVKGNAITASELNSRLLLLLSSKKSVLCQGAVLCCCNAHFRHKRLHPTPSKYDQRHSCCFPGKDCRKDWVKVSCFSSHLHIYILWPVFSTELMRGVEKLDWKHKLKK